MIVSSLNDFPLSGPVLKNKLADLTYVNISKPSKMNAGTLMKVNFKMI